MREVEPGVWEQECESCGEVFQGHRAALCPKCCPECLNDPFTQGLLNGEPFCACGRVLSNCDGSRRGCKERR